MEKKIKLEVKEEIGEEIGTPVITAPLPTSVEPVSSTAGGNVQAVNSEWEDLIPSTSSEWVWTKTLDRFLGMIRSEQWESRHGGSLAIRDLVLTQGKHAGERSGGSDRDNERRRRRTLRAVGRELILVLVSDRFGDYVGDTVVAPVREAASQALATTCRYLSMEDRRKVLHALLQMILQPWLGAGKGRGYVWELRHAGLLGLRYLLVVMEDLGEDLHSVLQATMVG
jgi:TATA-binding protein-associated factor